MHNRSIVLFPKGGLANRLRALASASILADSTGRNLFVNWITSSECNVEWKDLFTTDLSSYPSPLTKFTTGVNLYDDNDNCESFSWTMPRELERNRSDIVAVHSSQNFRPKGMSYETFKTEKSRFYKNLQPVSAVQEIVNTIHDQYFEGNNVIGIHIRRTNLGTPFGNNPDIVSPSREFEKKMKRILISCPKTKFFVATDDKEEEKLIKHLFQESVIVHEKDIICRDTTKGVQDALIDLLLLSKTSEIIGSYWSSFTQEAGAINMIETSRVLSKKLFLRLRMSMFFRTNYWLLRNDGLKMFLYYSWKYRRKQISGLIRKIL